MAAQGTTNGCQALFICLMSMWPEHLSRIILHQLTLECVGTVSKLVKSAPHCIFNFFGSLDFLPAARASREEWMRKVWSAVVRSSRLLQQLDDTVVQLSSGGECNSICKQGQRRGAASAARWPVACFQAETGHNLFHSPCLPHIGMETRGVRSGPKFTSCPHLCLGCQ